jgi:hypothetical protein
MKLTTREGKGSKLTIKEMDDNLLYLESLNKSNNPIIKAYFQSKLAYDNNTLYNGLDISLDKGIFLPYVEDLELPDTGFYVVSSVETYLRLLEPMFNTDSTNFTFLKYLLKIGTIDYSIMASVETYNKYLEAFKIYNFYNLNYQIKNPVLNEDFLNKFKDIEQYNTLNNTEVLDRFIDKGIVETGLINGKSQLDILFYISNQLGIINSNNYNSADFLFGLLMMDMILDKGIVILDTNKYPHINQIRVYQNCKGLILMSVESFLAYIQNNTGVPA